MSGSGPCGPWGAHLVIRSAAVALSAAFPLWWEPAVTGGLRSRGFFDEAGHALPVIGVFDRFTRK